MDGKFRLLSMKGSTMMKNTALRNGQSSWQNEGILQRLNKISKLYELAQLEGCLKFVQEEIASDILDYSNEDFIADLSEIRNRLLGRLKDSKMVLSEKDRELTEKFEIELKLRQALELKERELVSLRAKLREQKKKCQSVEAHMSSSPAGSDEMKDGEFCELKN